MLVHQRVYKWIGSLASQYHPICQAPRLCWAKIVPYRPLLLRSIVQGLGVAKRQRHLQILVLLYIELAQSHVAHFVSYNSWTPKVRTSKIAG